MTDNHEDKRPQVHIVVKDLPAMRLHVDISAVPNLDFAIDIVAHALRMLEAERRKQEQLEFLAEMHQREQEARLILKPQ